MKTKMLMRIYARVGGHSTDNPPYLRTARKQKEKRNIDAAGSAKADGELAELPMQTKIRTRC